MIGMQCMFYYFWHRSTKVSLMVIKTYMITDFKDDLLSFVNAPFLARCSNKNKMIPTTSGRRR